MPDFTRTLARHLRAPADGFGAAPGDAPAGPVQSVGLDTRFDGLMETDRGVPQDLTPDQMQEAAAHAPTNGHYANPDNVPQGQTLGTFAEGAAKGLPGAAVGIALSAAGGPGAVFGSAIGATASNVLAGGNAVAASGYDNAATANAIGLGGVKAP